MCFAMGMCRRVAANRVLLAGRKEILSNYVLEIDAQGHVVDGYPLAEELSRTEWFSGLIVVSPNLPVRENEETFTSFYERLSAIPFSENASCSVYAVSDFDVSRMEFTGKSRIFRV